MAAQVKFQAFHVGFVADRVAVRQDFLHVLQFQPVSIILPLFHIHSSITGCIIIN